MRKNIVKTIYLKEIKETLRDRKTVFLGIILPIILYPVLILGFSQLFLSSGQDLATKNLDVYMNFKTPALLEQVIEKTVGSSLEEGGLNLLSQEELRSISGDLDLEKALKNGKINAYVEQENGDFKIIYNSSSSDSQEAYIRLQDSFFVYRVAVTSQIIKDSGLEVEEVLVPFEIYNQNLAPPEQISFALFGQMLVILVIMGIVSGTIYPSIDSMAGEKERGTLETLLTLPISNLEIVTGKYLAVSSMAVFTALLSMASIGVSMFFMLIASIEQIGSIGLKLEISSLIGPFIILIISIVLLAMLITAVIMSVCALAKNVREASNYSTPVTLGFMLPAYASIIPGFELTTSTAIIPVVNISLLIKDVMVGDINTVLMMMVLVSTMAFTIIAIIILAKLFDSESVLFGNGKTFSILENRKNIKIGNLPGISDGILIFAIVMLVFIYVGGYLQSAYGLIGVGMYQILFLLIPIGYSLYIKTDLKTIFSIRKFTFKQGFASFLIWVGAFAISNFIANILLKVVGGTDTATELTNNLMAESGFVITFIVVAILPAICEEFLFRGFILGAFRYNGDIRRKTYIWAIISSGLLFGLMHIYFIKIIPTAILGIAFGYIVIKTGSILPAIILHLVNNGLAVIITFYQKALPAEVIQQAQIVSSSMGVLDLFYSFLPLLIFGLFCGYFGIRILKNYNVNQKL